MSEAPDIPEAKSEPSDPWIILIPAGIFIAIGAVLALAKHAERFTAGAASIHGSAQEEVMDAEGLHAIGWAGILLGLAIVVFYLKLRRELRQP